MAIDYRLYQKYAGHHRDPQAMRASALAGLSAAHSAHQCLPGRTGAEVYRDLQAIGILIQALIITALILCAVYAT